MNWRTAEVDFAGMAHASVTETHTKTEKRTEETEKIISFYLIDGAQLSKRILPLGTVGHDTWSSPAVLGAFSVTKLTSRPHELQNLGKVGHWTPQKGQYIDLKKNMTEMSTLHYVVLSFITKRISINCNFLIIPSTCNLI